MTHQPLKLIVEEPQPGAFVWKLQQTDANGQPMRTVREGESPADSYEVALASGTRALQAALREGETSPA
ncbi:hypothetical protein DFR41_11436 [Pseudacidovorax intermedius]|uniref:DUF1508 domain-containing protein n=1 Tax=Pseudacidovorax intermedius TaxID=433924 RepID=A0A370F8R7_9BURK|nr:hypothetical protein [Pseudacidovorax intermedius]RDI18589.1 hypothetical protein DFR41_11436 [Pseudacidovorax intermedius]